MSMDLSDNVFLSVIEIIHSEIQEYIGSNIVLCATKSEICATNSENNMCNKIRDVQ